MREHFDSIAAHYDLGKFDRTYYWQELVSIYREHVPPKSSVLDIGCGTGILLASLDPRRGAGLDMSPAMVKAARAKHPQYEFWTEDIARPARQEVFERVVICNVLEHLPDPGLAVDGLKAYADRRTRFVATVSNPLWAGPLHLAEVLGLKFPEGVHEWMSLRDIRRLLEWHGFEVEAVEGRILLPVRVPLLSGLVNRLARRRPLRRLCFVYVVVFRLKEGP